MQQYVFILGRNPDLSVAEIKAVFPSAKIIEQADNFLIIENMGIDCQAVLDRLGGTIKIGAIIESKNHLSEVVEILKQLSHGKKINFGVSYYGVDKDDFGMKIKKELKKLNISSRLVVGKDKALSSVIVQKNKCKEFLILGKKYLGQTCAVQGFEEYGERDFGRPKRDTLSGTLPPKLAQIMINLSQAQTTGVLLDPFCGSGTIIQEALLMGYKSIIGSDVSQKAIDETKENIKWLVANYKVDISQVEIFQHDVLSIGAKVKSAEAIVTEPFLGPPIKGSETEVQINEIADELENLYALAIEQFGKILKKDSKAIIVVPWFKKYDRKLNLEQAIKKAGFVAAQESLVYSRPDQHVWREIYQLTKH